MPERRIDREKQDKTGMKTIENQVLKIKPIDR